MLNILNNFELILKSINELKKKYKLQNKINIIAVSKKQNVHAIQKVINYGQKSFGENRIQEAIEKIPQIFKKNNIISISKKQSVHSIKKIINYGQKFFGKNIIHKDIEKIPQIFKKNIEWHFLGHLQTNKIKKTAELFHYVHSISNLKVAFQLDKECKKLQKKMKIFIQINTTDEKKKLALNPNKLNFFLDTIKNYSNLSVIGLMTMAKFTDNQKIISESFKQLRILRDHYQIYFPNLKYLSMGMSSDFKIAIKEGATHLRIGQAIFGERK